MQATRLGVSSSDREKLESLGIDVDALNLAATVYRTAISGVTRIGSEVTRPLGISHSGFVLLMSLWLFGPMEPRQLARIQGVAVPSITSLVNTLERQGLATRERSRLDRRLVTVSATEAGIGVACEAQRQAGQLELQFASVLSAEERAALQAYLDRYLAAVETVPSQADNASGPGLPKEKVGS